MGSIFSFFPGAQPISAAFLAPGASVGEFNVWLSHHVKDKKIVADSIIFESAIAPESDVSIVKRKTGEIREKSGIMKRMKIQRLARKLRKANSSSDEESKNLDLVENAGKMFA